jgi:hypothetical protein
MILSSKDNSDNLIINTIQNEYIFNFIIFANHKL